MKKIIAIMLCLVALISLGACGSAKVPSQDSSNRTGSASARKEILIVGIPDTPPTVDHSNGSGMVAQYMIIDNVMDYGAQWPLVQSQQPDMDFVSVPDFSDPRALVPQLFEKWEVSGDNQTATYTIKKGIKSAYGNELTTRDIQWKYERHVALGAVGNFFMTVTDVIGADGQVDFEIVDDYTFKTHSVGPNALHEYIMTSMYDTVWDSTEAQKHATEDDPWATEWISKNGGGFGAYYITDWVAGQQITMEANPNYFLGVPSIKKVIFKVIPESANRVAMLKRGEIDIATELSAKEIDSLKSESGVKVVDIPANTNEFLVLNEKLVPQFANQKVRQAINYAIPKDEIVETAYYGQAKAWDAVFTTVVPGALSQEQWMYSYDLDKAKALMEEAGYGEGFDVELYYSAGWPAHETIAIKMQESLAKIGITVSLRKTPTGSFDTLVRSYEAPFAILHEYPALPNGIFFMSLYYLGKDAGGAYGAFGFYDSKKADGLLINGIRTAFEKQQEISEQAQKTLMEEAPMGWVVESNYTCAIRENLEGFNWNFGQGTRFHLMNIKG